MASRLRVLAVFFLVLLAPGWVWAYAPPPIEGHVTDPTHRLAPADEAALEAKLARFLAETGDHVAVFVAPGLDGETVEDVAYATFNTWGVGAKGKDDGVLLVWAPTERKIRIETGRGNGDRLPDVRASRIIRDVITPRFKEEAYARGLDHGAEAIFAALRGQPFVPGEGAPGDTPDQAAAKPYVPTPMAPWKKIAIGVALAAYAAFMIRRASIPGGLGGGGGGGSSSGGSSSGGSSYSGGGGRSGGGGASGSY